MENNTGKNNNLRMVKVDWDAIEKKVQEHRMKQIRRFALIVAICIGVFIAYYIFMQHQSYTDYRILDKVERSDSAATHFKEFNGNLLKYSNDGASYTNTKNQMIWNQTFEMQTPEVTVCEKYAAFFDRDGKDIYIVNTDGSQGKITVPMSIQKVEVAAQGTVAVLMQQDGTSYLGLYNKEGDQLAEGTIHVENGGTPVDIALSSNARMLGVSILDVTNGTIKTTINFYNFGTVGQNQIDNQVGSFTYKDTVIADIAYADGEHMLAFGDNKVIAYSGSDKPKESYKMKVSGEIRSIFYNDSEFGLVFADKDEKKRNIQIYNMKCKQTAALNTDKSYENIEFLSNGEICMYNEQECAIYTESGLCKFHYEFEDSIYKVLHAGGWRKYILIREKETDRVRMKLFS